MVSLLLEIQNINIKTEANCFGAFVFLGLKTKVQGGPGIKASLCDTVFLRSACTT